jgi:hypothetical protein
MVLASHSKASPRARLARRSSLISHAVYGKQSAGSAGVVQVDFKLAMIFSEPLNSNINCDSAVHT